jgi:hypothetical protein
MMDDIFFFRKHQIVLKRKAKKDADKLEAEMRRENLEKNLASEVENN